MKKHLINYIEFIGLGSFEILSFVLVDKYYFELLFFVWSFVWSLICFISLLYSFSKVIASEKHTFESFSYSSKRILNKYGIVLMGVILIINIFGMGVTIILKY